MAAVEQQPQQQQQGQEQNQGRPPVTQLEFRQAMQDFKNMFPEMDEDVIEVVLRSNSGAVDATIDQLLAMSTDNENERLRTELDATENDELPPCYSPSTPPPSYQQAVPFAQSSGPSLTLLTVSTQATSPVISSSPVVSHTAISCLSPVQQSQLLEAQPHSSITPLHLSSNEGSEELTQVTTNEPLHNVRKWQPSLLGSLPHSFLRLDENFSQQTNSKIGDGDWQHQSSCGAEDPELSQYLEDERIALFLQNEEFMQELRDNKEFLSALEKASSDVSSQDDEDEALESDAFSQAQKIPASEDTDAAFREKLRNMGKSSTRRCPLHAAVCDTSLFLPTCAFHGFLHKTSSLQWMAYIS